MFSSAVVLGRLLPLRGAIVVASALLAVPSLVALALHGVPMAAGLGTLAIPRRAALLAVAAGLGFWVASLGLIEVQYAMWPPPDGYLEGFRRLHDALRPNSALDALWSAIAIAAAPALFEETTVRGVLLPALRSWLGGVGAVLASAVAFALMHADPYRFAFTFAVGAALGRKERAPYSNFGKELSVVAPGGDCDRDDDHDGEPDCVFQQMPDPDALDQGRHDAFCYCGLDGTSMAAPHVSAFAALLISQGITDPAAVRAAIEQTAEPLGGAAAGGRNDNFGHGLIHPEPALSGLGLNSGPKK